MDELSKIILNGLTPEEALRRNRDDLLRRVLGSRPADEASMMASMSNEGAENRFMPAVKDSGGKKHRPFSL